MSSVSLSPRTAALSRSSPRGGSIETSSLTPLRTEFAHIFQAHKLCEYFSEAWVSRRLLTGFSENSRMVLTVSRKHRAPRAQNDVQACALERARRSRARRSAAFIFYDFRFRGNAFSQRITVSASEHIGLARVFFFVLRAPQHCAGEAPARARQSGSDTEKRGSEPRRCIIWTNCIFLKKRSMIASETNIE